MQPLTHINTFDILKLLSDPRRMAVLRLLMSGPATLSQLSKTLGSYPSKTRHHVKQLEQAGLISLVETRVVGGYVEKYYQATAQAFIINMAVLPEPPSGEMIIASGSHDLALESLAQQMQADRRVPDVYALPVGSLDGLIALRQGVCQIAGAHLIEADGSDFNRSTVRHLFPGQPMALLTLAYREQGLLVAPGNPHQIQALTDLTRAGVRFVNRAQGTGTRLWLDRQMRRLGVATAVIQGYQTIAATHTQVAQTIAEGKADVGLGVLAAARKYNLDFIPLFEERYDLVLTKAATSDDLLLPLLDHLQTAVFRQTVAALDGYDATHTGEKQDVD
ncbi:MAG: helix-turn-helix domain-containing protein [Anaerolineales bacterium]|nr:helix-turn-helix domain-containing protein [Anaerolineales bacterium]